MPKPRDIAGVGTVHFPDTMSDDQINTAIEKMQAESSSGSMPFGATPEPISAPSLQPKTRQEGFGMLSNMLNTGIAGGELGAALGGAPGAVAGAAMGGTLGAFLPPSETPGTDVGATLGERAALMGANALTNRFAPGLGVAARIAKGAALPVGTGLGAFLGSKSDQAMGFQNDTPWGRIGVYSAMAGPTGIANAILSSEASPVAQAAARLKKDYGIEIPLNAMEQTGRFSKLGEDLTNGTAAASRLAVRQDAAAQSAMEKIIGAPLDQHLDTILKGEVLQNKLRKQVVGPFARDWKQANGSMVTKTLDTGSLDESGKFVLDKMSKFVPSKTVNWEEFQKAFGLTKEERDGFFRMLRVDPEQFLSKLMPTTANPTKGLLKLRGTMKVLENSGMKDEAGQLGQAFAMQYLRPSFEASQVANGAQYAKVIRNAIGTATEPGHLTIALGPDRAEALKDLATVLETADPLQKMGGGNSLQKRAGQYAFNKIYFSAMSSAGGATVGGFASGRGEKDKHMGTLLIGTATGALIGAAIPTLVGAMMSNPAVGKMLLGASRGINGSTERLIRTIGSSQTKNGEIQPELESPSSAVARMQGLFTTKK